MCIASSFPSLQGDVAGRAALGPALCRFPHPSAQAQGCAFSQSVVLPFPAGRRGKDDKGMVFLMVDDSLDIETSRWVLDSFGQWWQGGGGRRALTPTPLLSSFSLLLPFGPPEWLYYTQLY